MAAPRRTPRPADPPATSALALSITPAGQLVVRFEQAGDIQLLPEAAARIAAAFERGAGAGLLELGASEVTTALPPHLGFWRDLAARYVAAFTCSCPDYACMCKHVAAAMYGVGSRLDHAPELLFTLRGVSADELHAAALSELPAAPRSRKILAADGLSSLFGIELADSPAPPKAARAPRKPAKKTERRARRGRPRRRA